VHSIDSPAGEIATLPIILTLPLLAPIAITCLVAEFEAYNILSALTDSPKIHSPALKHCVGL
jgi:hypothetical protein